MSNAIRQGELKSNVAGGVGPVKIRFEPSLAAGYVEQPIGTRVTILAQQEPGDGFIWYRVIYQEGQVGWVREDVIQPDLSSPPQPDPNPAPDATRLYFETDTRKVRVFEDNAAVWMNVYNHRTAQTELNRIAATKLPNDRNWEETYLAIKDGLTYQASFVRRGATQLRITDREAAEAFPPESGYGATGTEYQQI